LAGLLVRDSGGGEFAKLVIHQRQELISSRGFALVELRQNARDVGYVAHVALLSLADYVGVSFDETLSQISEVTQHLRAGPGLTALFADSACNGCDGHSGNN
jgi:hypothetical protein